MPEIKTMELAIFKKQFRKLLQQPFGTITVIHNGMPFLKIQDLRQKALLETVKAHLGPHPTQEQVDQFTANLKELVIAGGMKTRGRKPGTAKKGA